MAYEMKAGQGSAFPNESKTEDWHADYRGRIMLPDGKTHWIDVSMKTSKDGKKYVALKVGKEVQALQPVYSAAHKPFTDQRQGLDSDIPF